MSIFDDIPDDCIPSQFFILSKPYTCRFCGCEVPIDDNGVAPLECDDCDKKNIWKYILTPPEICQTQRAL